MLFLHFRKHNHTVPDSYCTYYTCNTSHIDLLLKFVPVLFKSAPCSRLTAKQWESVMSLWSTQDFSNFSSIHISIGSGNKKSAFNQKTTQRAHLGQEAEAWLTGQTPCYHQPQCFLLPNTKRLKVSTVRLHLHVFHIIHSIQSICLNTVHVSLIGHCSMCTSPGSSWVQRTPCVLNRRWLSLSIYGMLFHPRC